jgi:transposase-like protein
MQIEITVRYEAGHSYVERWELSKMYCPNCADGCVWVERGEGDFYAGPQYLCTKCRHQFHLCDGPMKAEGWQNQQRLEAIKRPG